MTLSDKRNTIDDNFNVTYLEEDVKEFIRELKEELKVHERINPWIIGKIDKRAGDKLITKQEEKHGI